MMNCRLSDSNDNISFFELNSCKIVVSDEDKTVLFMLSSEEKEFKYLLQEDQKAGNVQTIKKCLDEIIETVSTKNYILKINEYTIRHYIQVGYESGQDFKLLEFTGIRI